MNAVHLSSITGARKKRLAVRRLAFSLLCAGLLGGVPLVASSQTLEWSPWTMDFGEVPFGTTAYRTLTLTNADPVDPLTISQVEFTFNLAGQFDFTTSQPLPAVVLPGLSMEVEFSFTPTEISFSQADVLITNDSTNAAYLNYHMEGQGIEFDICYPLASCDGLCVDLQTDLENCGSCGNACGPVVNGTAACDVGQCNITCDEGYELVGGECEPIVSLTALEMLRLLISDVDEYIADGLLFGYGPGASAEANLRNFIRALSDAEINLRVGVIDNACDLLSVWPRRCDGGFPLRLPPDQLAGEMAYAVSDRIIEVMEAIAAEYPDVPCEPRPAIERPVR
jgi:hypothetical protein